MVASNIKAQLMDEEGHQALCEEELVFKEKAPKGLVR